MAKTDYYRPRKPRKKRNHIGVEVSSCTIHPDFDAQEEYMDYLRGRLKGRGEL